MPYKTEQYTHTYWVDDPADFAVTDANADWLALDPPDDWPADRVSSLEQSIAQFTSKLENEHPDTAAYLRQVNPLSPDGDGPETEQVISDVMHTASGVEFPNEQARVDFCNHIAPSLTETLTFAVGEIVFDQALSSMAAAPTAPAAHYATRRRRG